MGYKIGEEIGYNVRFQEKRSDKTKVTFMTDGMAIREIMVGNMFDVFVIDQAHERSINTDVLLALLRDKMIKNSQLAIKSKSQQKGHKNNQLQHHNNNNSKIKQFKIVIMSATI